MRTEKITEEAIKEMKISSLPTRPTAPSSLGGRGFSPEQMKAAFDRLPLFIIERFNLLIDDICSSGKESLSGAIMTGIYEGHSLFDLFSDIKSGRVAEYLSLGGGSLALEIARINERLSRLEEKRNEQNAD